MNQAHAILGSRCRAVLRDGDAGDGALARLGDSSIGALLASLIALVFSGSLGCESSEPESPTRSANDGGTPTQDDDDESSDDDDGDEDDEDENATGTAVSKGGWALLFQAPISGVPAGTVVTALTRVDATHAVAHVADGSAIAVDLEAGTTTALPVPFDVPEGSRVITASTDFAWVMAADGKTAGRNRQPASSSRVEISRVNVADLASVGETAEPVAATNERLFFVAADALVVLTWVEPTIKVQRIKFPADYVKDGDEVVLGAGQIGALPDAWWVATDKRLLTYEGDGTWSRVSLELGANAGVGEPRRAALWVTGDQPRPRNGALVFGEGGLGKFLVDRP